MAPLALVGTLPCLRSRARQIKDFRYIRTPLILTSSFFPALKILFRFLPMRRAPCVTTRHVASRVALMKSNGTVRALKVCSLESSDGPISMIPTMFFGGQYLKTTLQRGMAALVRAEFTIQTIPRTFFNG